MVLVAALPDVAGSRWWRPLAGAVGDVALVLLLGALLPVAILAIGTPIALTVLVLIELVNRL
jgi:hypothetical protein